jgi:hypothetical protein
LSAIEPVECPTRAREYAGRRPAPRPRLRSAAASVRGKPAPTRPEQSAPGESSRPCLRVPVVTRPLRRRHRALRQVRPGAPLETARARRDMTALAQLTRHNRRSRDSMSAPFNARPLPRTRQMRRLEVQQAALSRQGRLARVAGRPQTPAASMRRASGSGGLPWRPYADAGLGMSQATG